MNELEQIDTMSLLSIMKSPRENEQCTQNGHPVIVCMLSYIQTCTVGMQQVRLAVHIHVQTTGQGFVYSRGETVGT